MLLVQVGKRNTICHLTFPRIHLRLMRPDSFIIHLVRHYLRCTFDFIIRASVEGMRTLSPHPAIKVHGNHFIAGTVRHNNVMNLYIDSGL